MRSQNISYKKFVSRLKIKIGIFLCSLQISCFPSGSLALIPILYFGTMGLLCGLSGFDRFQLFFRPVWVNGVAASLMMGEETSRDWDRDQQQEPSWKSTFLQLQLLISQVSFSETLFLELLEHLCGQKRAYTNLKKKWHFGNLDGLQTIQHTLPGRPLLFRNELFPVRAILF